MSKIKMTEDTTDAQMMHKGRPVGLMSNDVLQQYITLYDTFYVSQYPWMIMRSILSRGVDKGEEVFSANSPNSFTTVK